MTCCAVFCVNASSYACTQCVHSPRLGVHNANNTRYGDRLKKLCDDANAKFTDYLTKDGVDVSGEFLLPCNEGDDAVTSFTTFVHGGSQYAFNVKYVVTLALCRQQRA